MKNSMNGYKDWLILLAITMVSIICIMSINIHSYFSFDKEEVINKGIKANSKNAELKQNNEFDVVEFQKDLDILRKKEKEFYSLRRNLFPNEPIKEEVKVMEKAIEIKTETVKEVLPENKIENKVEKKPKRTQEMKRLKEIKNEIKETDDNAIINTENGGISPGSTKSQN